MVRPVPLRDVIAAIERAYPDDSLDQLAAAVILAAHWSRLGDQLLDSCVAEARHAGLSWAEIAPHLGVSRQAAQQRFSAYVAEWDVATTFGADS
ncbi:hypothetical protein ACIBCN_04785 [Nocardia sp. NPDC051052]|uniref:hypothetical protein n=1 Tax=Nocardia sp. NPDC051052 TaxID=3364322 RepID=UPI0037B27A01